MAIKNDYTTGTITLTSGSANFTTSGAALQTNGVLAGDEILLPSKGLILIIASITGENSGTLVANCPAGAAGAGQALRIRFQPDGSRYAAAARDVLTKLASGNVDALAGLTSAADKVPYFTGSGAADLASFPAWARSMLGNTMAANKMLYGTGADTMGLADATTAGLALLGSANAGAQLNNLGVSAFMQTVLDDASANTVLGTLQLRFNFGNVADDAAASIDVGSAGVGSAVVGVLLLSNASARGAGYLLVNTAGSPSVTVISQIGSVIVESAGASPILAGGGTDGKLNVRATLGKLSLSNRTGGIGAYLAYVFN